MRKEGKVFESEEEARMAVESEEELEEADLDEDEPEKATKEKIPKPKAGDILNYTREVDTYVIDEKGDRLLCNEENKDMIQAKTLSLLFEIKLMIGKKEK